MKKLNVMTVKALRDICHPDTGELIIEKNHVYYLDVDSIRLRHDGIKGDIYTTEHKFVKTAFLYNNFITQSENKHEVMIVDTEYYKAKNIPVKTVNFPVVWKSWGEIPLTVPCMWDSSQILKYFQDNLSLISLPKDGEYIEDSLTCEFTQETINNITLREVK